MMDIEILLAGPDCLPEYATVSIAFEVRARLRPVLLDGGLGGIAVGCVVPLCCDATVSSSRIGNIVDCARTLKPPAMNTSANPEKAVTRQSMIYNLLSPSMNVT